MDKLHRQTFNTVILYLIKRMILIRVTLVIVGCVQVHIKDTN